MKKILFITLILSFSMLSCYSGWDEAYNLESFIVPASPDSPEVTAGDGILKAEWTAVAGATAYEIWYNTTDNTEGAIQPAGSGDITGTSYTIQGLANETTYYVWLKSKNQDGSSDFSASSTGTPGLFPTVTTTAIAGNLTFTPYIAGTSARGGGNVTANGSSSVTDRGLCWNTTGNPTINDSKISDGAGSGVFSSSSMRGLIENTTYFVRAYSTNRVGTAYGAEISFNSGKSFGTVYAGGYVFYNDGNAHGLVSAKTDQSLSAQWNNGGSIPETGATATYIGSGQLNTSAIIAAQGDTGVYAAKICNDLNLESCDDWFLPSKDELNQMYTKLKAAGIGGFANDYYWNSSENSEYNAWYQFFNDGYQNYYYKGTTYYVRAARAF